jgi:hypothetical protein
LKGLWFATIQKPDFLRENPALFLYIE